MRIGREIFAPPPSPLFHPPPPPPPAINNERSLMNIEKLISGMFFSIQSACDLGSAVNLPIVAMFHPCISSTIKLIHRSLCLSMITLPTTMNCVTFQSRLIMSLPFLCHTEVYLSL